MRFIDKYREFAGETTDAPDMFHEFLAYALVSAITQRKVYIPTGVNGIYPNLYLVLIAPSSNFRKTTSLNIAKSILNEIVPDIILPNEFSLEKLAEIISVQNSGLFVFSEFKTLLSLMKRDYMAGANAFITDLYDCCLDDTEILTNNGWRTVDTIKETDLAVTFNVNSDVLEYSKIHHVILKNSEEIVKIKSKIFDAAITPSHRMLFKYRKDSDAIDKYRFRTAESMINKKTEFVIPISSNYPFNEIDVPDEIIALSGWIITDGCITKREEIIISQGERKLKKITILLDKMKINYTVRKTTKNGEFRGYINNSPVIARQNVYRIYIIKNQLKENLKWIELLKTKQIPELYKKMSSRQFNIFLDSLIDGDGSHLSKTNKIFTTNKSSVIDTLQEMATMRGWATYCKKYPNREIWRITFNKKKSICLTGSNFRCKNQRIKKEKGNYRVWCINTDNGTLVARRNGKVFITGNSIGGYNRKTKTGEFRIDLPFISLWAATTMEWFVKELKDDDISSGFLARFLFIVARDKTKSLPFPPPADMKKRAEIISDLKEMAKLEGKSGLSKEAKSAYIEIYEKNKYKIDNVEHQFSCIYSRLNIYLLKFALLNAVMRGSLIINLEDLYTAQGFIEYATLSIEDIVENNITYSKSHANVKRILDIVSSVKEKGICRSDLIWKSHFSAKDLSETIATLQEADKVYIRREKGTGHKDRIFYYSTEFVGEDGKAKQET